MTELHELRQMIESQPSLKFGGPAFTLFAIRRSEVAGGVGRRHVCLPPSDSPLRGARQLARVRPQGSGGLAHLRSGNVVRAIIPAHANPSPPLVVRRPA
jgi:hypothetical protein